MSLKKVVTSLSASREFVSEIDGHELVFSPDPTPAVAELINSYEAFAPGPGQQIGAIQLSMRCKSDVVYVEYYG